MYRTWVIIILSLITLRRHDELSTLKLVIMLHIIVGWQTSYKNNVTSYTDTHDNTAVYDNVFHTLLLRIVRLSIARASAAAVVAAASATLSKTTREASSNGVTHGTLGFRKKIKTSAMSKTDWMVKTQLCKLRDISDTLVGRAYSISHL